MKCGACGAPLARGIVHCPFCGATAKYAITEAGALPYEYVPAVSQLKELEPPEPRWDLEPPEGTSQSYYKVMRPTYERWAALERWRLANKGRLGCALLSILFVLFVSSCALFSLASSEARMQSGPGTLSAREITATATANPNPYLPGRGQLTLNNFLNQNSNAAWTNYGADSRPINQGCTFQNGSYDTSKSTQSAPSIKYCLANRTNFRNFTYQIQMVNLQGDCGGTVFRESAPGDYYYFSVCTNGRYTLWLNSGTRGAALAQGTSTAIRQGINLANTLAVVANGPDIAVYANQVPLATVHDVAYSTGKIGTAVGAPDEKATECVFNFVKVWML